MIIGLGDSTTAGTPGFRSPIEHPPHGSGDETSQYAYWLMQTHPMWSVLNHGVNGERSDQVRRRFERDVVPMRPRLVILIAGVNDVYQGRAADAVIAELAAIFERARRDRIPVVAGTILPFNTATADQNVRMRAVNDWLHHDASRLPGVTLCDTRSALAAPGAPDRLVSSPDDLHPSPEGYRLMALALEPTIQKALVAGSR
jgi:lysophospholipase L1-like esterase